ncbi:hypothetical protein LC653_42225 [Nostoc sp. CHAB 5784]|uniref:hypothetical protein n=1 Tax=Nostoc mirabile TaxID=2907820 RepID=UPI001E5C12B2|nr:hypothetical protein [Nostoc mirabile]MCC5670234.1 hypothetical protein [Nostoc mirabile CHAB5784]
MQIREKIDWGDDWWTTPHRSDVYDGLRLRYFSLHPQISLLSAPSPATMSCVPPRKKLKFADAVYGRGSTWGCLEKANMSMMGHLLALDVNKDIGFEMRYP